MTDAYQEAEGHRLPLCFEITARFRCLKTGNANPSYGLSCFADVWVDTCVAAADLRKIWREV